MKKELNIFHNKSLACAMPTAMRWDSNSQSIECHNTILVQTYVLNTPNSI